jgi:hypothetical protein
MDKNEEQPGDCFIRVLEPEKFFFVVINQSITVHFVSLVLFKISFRRLLIIVNCLH